MSAEDALRPVLPEEPSVVIAPGEGAIVIDDAALLYGAEFLRDGPDLVLRSAGAADIRIVDYFRAGAPADLHSADGGTLRGSVVERLAGPEAPGQYAQAGQVQTAVPIGQVETVDGSASVQRTDGSTEPLTEAARIFMGDVVRTVGDSTLSITFADGTIFTLSADSRMVIDELIYSPAGSGNSATFNLVQGGFVFIAGQVARSGGMEVNTPAATMGIRGTTVLADVRTEAGVSTVEVTLTRDPNGGIGRVELFDLTGNLITTITGTDTKWIVSTEEGQTREVERTADDEAADNVLIDDAVAAYQQAQGRFAQDGSFIDLDRLRRNPDGDGTDGEAGDSEIDLDSEDEGVVPEIEDAPEPDRPENDDFDEGRLAPLQETPNGDVFRTAIEDPEEEPVAGQLRAETRLQGEFILVSAAANGTVTLARDGSYSYVPDPNFNGIDQFSYTVIGPGGTPASGTVTINVLPVNDAPVIDEGPIAGETAVFEDVAPSVGGRLTATDPDANEVLTWSGSAAGTYGTFAITPAGVWSYTLGPAANALRAGQEVTERFTVTVTDIAGESNSRELSIAVVGSNDAPKASFAAFAVPGAAGIEAALTASDPDAGDTLSFSLGAAGPAHGVLELQADGTFSYVPDAGYAGLDGFDYVVTDASGASVSARATLSVESGPVTVPGGSQISVSIFPDPEVGPAGQIVATSTPPEPASINLAIALDRSGSIGLAGWNTQINAVADALDSLAAEFAGSETRIDVNVITFASFADSIGTFDITDPDLIATVRNLSFTGGGTNWSRPLELAEGFFDAQPPGETGFLYFVSDGEPFDQNWPQVLARMTDAQAKGYTLTVEAFGIGPALDEATLSILDPDPVLLNGPGDLLAAFEASPLFAPQLADLSVRLVTDGVDLGQVADETTPGIVVDGLDTKLALADIAGLAERLGESNFISVTAGFDLDGDESTAEVELFTSQLFAKQGQAMTLDGTEESDLLFGSDLPDVLAGNGGNDILLGFGGNDLISTGAGLDHVRAGAGDDRIVLDSIEPPADGFVNTIDGGTGRDVLAFGFGGDLTATLPLLDLRGIEAIDMENGAANTLDLTLEDVLGLSDEADTELEMLLGAALPESLSIRGDASDTLTLAGGEGGSFVDTDQSVSDGDGTTFDIYTYVSGGEVLATIAVDSDVAVTATPAIG